MKMIRQLTDTERQCTAKYRRALAEAEQRVAFLREILADMAMAFSGRDGVLMDPDALYEPEVSSGS